MVFLDLKDIQGNVLRGYRFREGVYVFVRFPDLTRGCELLRDLLPCVTDAGEWTDEPTVATNIAMTFAGLHALGVDPALLDQLPDAFKEPMRERARCILGDNVKDWEAGVGDGTAHMLVQLFGSGTDVPDADWADADWDRPASGKLLAAESRLDRRLAHHGATCVHRQFVRVLEKQREHFGFADGFGQPAVEGMTRTWPGQGTPEPDSRAWRDIKAGEFILGYPDEDGACIGGDTAWLLRNGTYMVYRKLRQDVPAFREAVTEAAARYCDVTGASLAPDAAFERMAAMLVGRWRDGLALTLNQQLDRGGDLDREAAAEPTDNDFRYGDDRDGFVCPRGAHVRRANPRDLAGPDGRGSRRHRIIRRGMPYGPPYADGVEAERGLIFVCFNADLERQFELIQAHWCNDGNAFGLGDDQDYLLGSRSPPGKFVVEGRPPCFVSRTNELVTTCGCEYLLMPGLTALHRLAAPRATELESVNATEHEAVGRVVDLVRQEMRRTWGTSRPVRRGQHPKSHGCVEARFIVADDVPVDLQEGLFARPGAYKAWVRFSGSHAALRSDAKSDAHGMSIKLMGVMGEKVLPGERWATTQDFLMVNHDVFFCRDAVEYADFAELITASGSVRHESLRRQCRTVEFFLRRGQLRGLRNLLAVISQRVANPLEIRYWSQTPFAFGPHVVKYSARPRNVTPGRSRPPREWDGLFETVAASLAAHGGEFAFDFLVQRQADPQTMPVEDATVRWNEAASPYRKVATIHIPSQDVRDQERRNFGERLVFTPWHSLWEHRPLGGINRVRHAVYEASRELRQELNGVPHYEPGETVPEHLRWPECP
jgi:Dyp-type peroxidase family